MQKHVIKGNLKGFLCKDCSEPVFPAKVQLYLPWQEKQVLANVVADTKETFRLVSEKEAKQREKLLLAQTETDAEGNFRIEVDSKHAGSAFDIDFKCANVPRVLLGGIKGEPRPPQPPQQFHLTTIPPRWSMQKQAGNQQEAVEMLFKWEYIIPARWWCYIRGHFFDTWTICGQLRNCQTGQPIARATVEAWDADLISDDLLGSATTDVNGHFRIDYSSADFRRNAFPLNLETDPGIPFFSSGPDVYFKATLGGVTLLNEGKANRRNNVGYCLCVDLCTEIQVAENIDDYFPCAWTGIGRRFNVSWEGGEDDFDTEGYAGREKFALCNSIRLTGQAPTKSAAGNPLEYRFVISEHTTPNGSAPPPTEGFHPNMELFVPSLVGKLRRKTFPYLVHSVKSSIDDFDDGWFDINKAIKRTQDLLSLDLNNYSFIDEDTLMMLDTRKLKTPNDFMSVPVEAGDEFPASGKVEVKKVAIRFEVREVIDKTANIFNYLTDSGQTLNSVVINNDNPCLKLNIDKFKIGGTCTPIENDVNALYTIYHPHLQSADIKLLKGNIYNRTLSDSFLPLNGNTNPAVQDGYNSELKINEPNNLERCSYTVELYINLRLHNGENPLVTPPVRVPFCYEGRRTS